MARIRVRTKNLTEGMIVAEDIFTFSGILIITKGSVLTEKTIEKIKQHFISSLLIEQVANSESEEQTYSESIKQSSEFKAFKNEYTKTQETIQHQLNDIIYLDKEVNAKQLTQQIDSLRSKVNNDIELFDMLNNMKDDDDTTYHHSLSVALISNMLGKWARLNSNDLEPLMLAALLHDIGKIKIPKEILEKKGALSTHEYSIVQKHAIYSYDILKTKNIEPRIKEVALMHHERCDGSGYPFHIQGNAMTEFAKIVSIIDVYDAMTSNRIWRDKICPFEAIQMFETEGYQKFDTTYLLTFLSSIVDAYIHYDVELSNGDIGQIIYVNKSNPSRPMIKSGNRYIDLSVYRDITVKQIL